MNAAPDSSPVSHINVVVPQLSPLSLVFSGPHKRNYQRGPSVVEIVAGDFRGGGWSDCVDFYQHKCYGTRYKVETSVLLVILV